MWQIHCIDGFGSGSAVLFRLHHGIADGITLTRVLLSLTSTDVHAGFTAATGDRGAVAVVGIIGWVPGAGDVGLGVSMFSYRGSVVIGLIADLRLIPDVSRLARLLGESLAALNADI